MFGLKLCQLLYFIIIYISSFTNPLAERLVIKIINSSTCIMHEFVLREKTVNLHFHLNVNKLGTTTNNNLHPLRFFHDITRVNIVQMVVHHFKFYWRAMLINKIFDSASFHKIFVRYRSIYMTSWSIIPQIKENICRIQLTEDQNDSQIEFNCGKEKKKILFSS